MTNEGDPTGPARKGAAAGEGQRAAAALVELRLAEQQIARPRRFTAHRKGCPRR